MDSNSAQICPRSRSAVLKGSTGLFTSDVGFFYTPPPKIEFLGKDSVQHSGPKYKDRFVFTLMTKRS